MNPEVKPATGKLAVVLREFTLKKSSEFFLDRYSEPYIVSLAADTHSVKASALEFNVLPFPNIRKGDTVRFDGQGHLIYGPANPGDFLAYTVLFMESDKAYRDSGKILKNILSQASLTKEIKSAFGKNKADVIYQIVLKISGLLAESLRSDQDDELFRRSGCLLQNVNPPYDMLRTYTSENDFIRAAISIIPQDKSNEMGSQPKRIKVVT